MLAAEPLYLLFDTAVVGRLGALSLAGLAIGGLILGMVGSQLTFLSYGTTARSARHFGAGDRRRRSARACRPPGWRSGLGVLIVAVVQAVAVPLVSVIAGSAATSPHAALPWLRIAIVGAPAILVSLAGNGWMRGVQDTARPLRYVVAGFAVSAVLCPLLVYGWLGLPRLELAGSAVANLVGSVAGRAAVLARAAGRAGAAARPNRRALRAQVVMGRDLLVRTLAFQACFVSAAAVAARFGAAAVAAHQVVLQLWSFLALVLDSLAIAAQSLVGAALGGGDVAAREVGGPAGDGVLGRRRRGVGRRVRRRCLGAARAVHRRPLGAGAIGVPWWFMVAQLPVAGIVFALDGVLLGAGDAAFMRTATVVSALVGFLPLIWLSLASAGGWSASGRGSARSWCCV